LGIAFTSAIERLREDGVLAAGEAVRGRREGDAQEIDALEERRLARPLRGRVHVDEDGRGGGGCARVVGCARGQLIDAGRNIAPIKIEARAVAALAELHAVGEELDLSDE